MKVKVKSLSHVWLFATPWTVVYQAPLSMVFSRQGYWSGLPFSSPGDLPDPGIKPGSPTLQADALPIWATIDLRLASFFLTSGIAKFWILSWKQQGKSLSVAQGLLISLVCFKLHTLSAGDSVSRTLLLYILAVNFSYVFRYNAHFTQMWSGFRTEHAWSQQVRKQY